MDGLTNAEEQEIGTRADLKDTDGDGLNDGDEAVPTDPDLRLPRVPEVTYAAISIYKPDAPDESTTLNAWINNKAQLVVKHDRQLYFLENAMAEPETIEDPLFGYWDFKGLNDKGQVLLSDPVGHLVDEPTMGPFHGTLARSVRRQPAIWSKQGGLKYLSTDLGQVQFGLLVGLSGRDGLG